MIGVIDCGWIVADTQRFQPPPTHADALATFVTSSGLPIELRWSKNTQCTFRLKTTDDLFELSFRTRSWKCGALRRDGASLRRLDSLETKTFRLCRGFEASPQHNTSLRTGSFSFWKSAKVATRFFTLTLQWNTLLCQKKSIMYMYMSEVQRAQNGMVPHLNIPQLRPICKTFPQHVYRLISSVH